MSEFNVHTWWNVLDKQLFILFKRLGTCGDNCFNVTTKLLANIYYSRSSHFR